MRNSGKWSSRWRRRRRPVPTIPRNLRDTTLAPSARAEETRGGVCPGRLLGRAGPDLKVVGVEMGRDILGGGDVEAIAARRRKHKGDVAGEQQRFMSGGKRSGRRH